MDPVLLIDDDRLTCTRLQESLARWEIPLNTASTLSDGLHMARTRTHSLILVDLFLGHETGITLVRQLRDLHFQLPILIYSGHVAPYFESQAIDAGANGYIEKRISDALLAERIRLHIRRAARGSSERRTTIGRATLEHETSSLETGGKTIRLTATEFDILELLFTEKPERITDRELLDKIWGTPSLRTENLTHTIVKRLQRKLDDTGILHGLIEDQAGEAFRFNLQLLCFR